MILTAIDAAIWLLDPRQWRRRLAQLGASLGVLAWIWVRAVQVSPRRDAVREDRRLERRRVVREANERLERARYVLDPPAR